jgi:hypothetical protein
MKHWNWKLMIKEGEDGPEIDLLDCVNLTKEEEDNIPTNKMYPNFCLYKSPYRLKCLEEWEKIRKEVYVSVIEVGFKLTPNMKTLIKCGTK